MLLLVCWNLFSVNQGIHHLVVYVLQKESHSLPPQPINIYFIYPPLVCEHGPPLISLSLLPVIAGCRDYVCAVVTGKGSILVLSPTYISAIVSHISFHTFLLVSQF